MNKKITLLSLIIMGILSLFVFAPCFAVDRNDLNVEFFNRFNDGYLFQYVNEAIENNHNAKQATIRVEEYRQSVKSQFANELPSFSVAANYLGIHSPKFNPNLSVSKNAFVLPFIANYEADFLLKNRDKTKSVQKTYEMSKFDEQSAYLALLSDVATVYTNILEYDKLIEEQEKIVDNYNQILNDYNKKLARGVINTTELNNSKTNVEQANITLENLIKQREVLLMQFAVLIGRSANGANSIERGSIDNFEYNAVIPSEIESDVIFSRPDVKRAEMALEKAKIDIRVARKEFLPRFNITGIWAFNTIAPGTFFSWESSLAALLAGATQDIFTGGRKIANLKFKKTKYEELFEQYRQTDLDAVKEVNTSLCIIKHDTEIENKTKEKLLLETKNLNNADKMLNRGVISKTQHINSENMYINKDMDLTKAKTRRLVNYYTLYKTVGGKL
ncbi:MAG: TolC family protein [Candidatus Gastranaerophilaceae bacterium]|nr:TolC family protein [Candidatus Gastranaerophilaceae bacterium]